MNATALVLSFAMTALAAVACAPQSLPSRPAHDAGSTKALAAPASTALASRPPRTDLQSTSALVQRPEVQQLVEVLAAMTAVADEYVGYDGHPSAEFAAFEQLRSTARGSEMHALLLHESPVVRGYAAWHAIRHDQESPELTALLSDDATVDTRYGCLGGRMSLSMVTLQELCDSSAKPRAAAQLEALARGADERARKARACLTR